MYTLENMLSPPWRWCSVCAAIEPVFVVLMVTALALSRNQLHTWSLQDFSRNRAEYTLNYCWGNCMFHFALPLFPQPFQCCCALFANRRHINTIIYLKFLEDLSNRGQTWRNSLVTGFGLLVQTNDVSINCLNKMILIVCWMLCGLECYLNSLTTEM